MGVCFLNCTTRGTCDDASTMTLVVQWWFFVPFGTRGRVLYSLSGNHPKCPIIQMTDTEVTFLSYYNTVGHTRVYVMTLTSVSFVSVRTIKGRSSPSISATLQTLGRVECATIHVVTPPDSWIVTPLSFTLFSHRLLEVQKFDSERYHQSSHPHWDLARTHKCRLS